MHLISEFGRSRSANFAIAAALGVLPLVVALGGAVDYARLHHAASAAQDAADAAALAAAKAMETGSIEAAKVEAQLYGRAQLPSALSDMVLSEMIDQPNGTVTVTATGVVKSAFLKLLKIDEMPYEMTSISKVKQKGFIDFYFLLDVSESMNIAASDADRQKLQAITKAESNRPCAFACHTAEPAVSPISVFQMNQNAGSGKARLRIDVLHEASDSMIDRLLERNSDPKAALDIRIQTNGFSDAFEKGVGPMVDPIQLKSSIRTFGVANAHTNYDAAFSGLSAQIGAQGDGKSAQSPKKAVLMITDGVRDDGTLGPIDERKCAEIKAKGIDLAILEVKYVEDYDIEGFFESRVAWYYPKITKNLKSCASEGLHYMATDSFDAQEKLLTLADKLATNKLRIAR